VQARKYVDTRCTFYGKPLLESGTLGVKANVQPIIPHLTQCYNDVDDAPPKSIAVCTLKQFPYKVEHTIQWARDHFSKYFEKDPAEVNGYLLGKETWVGDMRAQNTGYSSLQTVHAMLCGADGTPGTGVLTTFADCVAWARLLFEHLFANTIKQLLAMYPADKMINLGTEAAPQMVKFWRGEKKVCSPAVFDAGASGGNEDHVNFIVAAAHLCAAIYGVSATSGEDRSVDAIREIATRVSVPEFRANKNKKIAVTEEEAKEQAKEGDAALGIDVDAEFARLSSDLAAKDDHICSLVKKMSPETFEKDDDTNHHMDFITACSNLRCHNYGIRDGSGRVGADKMKTRKIAGNIIPAIATTTALTTGAAMLELFKVVNGRSNIEAYRAYNFNLGINCFLGFEPTPCATEMFCGKEFSVWSYIDVDDMTLGDLLDWFEEQYGKDIEAVNSGSMCLVNTMLYDDELIDARKEKKLSDLVKEVSGKAPEGKFFLLSCYLDDDDDDDSDDSDEESSDEDELESFMPQIRVRLGGE
jgi:ubiquitin-activating enzyme E1